MPKGKNRVYSVVKRGLDMMFSLVFLVILSPFFLIIASLIKIDSPGPVLFRQKRTGLNGKDFRILKFRSMVADNDIYDNSCEDKYTRIGGLLRKTSIDELPQLLNVLVGQMSFIGPRPWVSEYWSNMNSEEKRRNSVRPGITGLAAAKGRNGLTVFEKIRYDLEYVDNLSFWQDIKILGLTAKTILARKNTSSNKEVIHDELKTLKARRVKSVHR